MAFTFAIIAVNCAATCSHNWSLFRILHPGGNCSIVTGDKCFRSEGIKSGIPARKFPISGIELWGIFALTSVLSLSLHLADSSFGQLWINQDSSSRTITHCMESCCSLSVQHWRLSWGGNAALYSLSAVNLESISCIQPRRFLVKKIERKRSYNHWVLHCTSFFKALPLTKIIFKKNLDNNFSWKN